MWQGRDCRGSVGQARIRLSVAVDTATAAGMVRRPPPSGDDSLLAWRGPLTAKLAKLLVRLGEAVGAGQQRYAPSDGETEAALVKLCTEVRIGARLRER